MEEVADSDECDSAGLAGDDAASPATTHILPPPPWPAAAAGRSLCRAGWGLRSESVSSESGMRRGVWPEHHSLGTATLLAPAPAPPAPPPIPAAAPAPAPGTGRCGERGGRAAATTRMDGSTSRFCGAWVASSQPCAAARWSAQAAPLHGIAAGPGGSQAHEAGAEPGSGGSRRKTACAGRLRPPPMLQGPRLLVAR